MTAWPGPAFGQGRLGRSASAPTCAAGRWLTQSGLSQEVFSQDVFSCRVSGVQPAVVLRSMPVLHRCSINTARVQARGWSHSFYQFACLCDVVVISGHKMGWSHAGWVTGRLGHGRSGHSGGLLALGITGCSTGRCLAQRSWVQAQFRASHSSLSLPRSRRSSEPLRAACLR